MAYIDKLTLEQMRNRVKVACGESKPDFVLKNANYVNVFTEKIEQADIAIYDGHIVGIGKYSADKEIDCHDKIVCPALIDGHVHLESAMVSPKTFRDLVVPHGTCAVIADPHEITNVGGFYGMNYILEMTKDLDLRVCVMVPSCVPSTPLDESGAELYAKDIIPCYDNDRIYGLAEMMNAFGVTHDNVDCLEKCVDCLNIGKLVDGHAPALTGQALNGYLTANISTDHECETLDEALEKLSRGQWIEVREGTVCRNLEALMGLFKAPYYQRCILATDYNHADTLLNFGHIDKIIRMAIKFGADPIKAIKMGSLNPANHYGLQNYGAIANGYLANFIILNDLDSFDIDSVYLNGIKVSENYKPLVKFDQKNNTLDKNEYKSIYDSFHLDDISVTDLDFKKTGKQLRALELVPKGVLTKEVVVDIEEDQDGLSYGVNLKNDIAKIVVVERHKNTNHIGLGFIKDYGIKTGAVASSIGHDSHNIIAVGVKDEDIVLAVNTLKNNKGGIVVVNEGKVLGSLVLEVAGLMTEQDGQYVIDTLEKLKEICYDVLKVNHIHDPFMTLAFMQLPVIPELKIIPKGLVRVMDQEIVDAIF